MGQKFDHSTIYSTTLRWRLTLIKKTKVQVAHSNTNPPSGQYLTHAHSHITQAVAAMDSCRGLVRRHQHGITKPKQLSMAATAQII